MTSRAPGSPLPHQLALNRPQCAGQACLDFVVARPIERKADVTLLQANPLPENWKEQHNGGHSPCHYAAHHHLNWPGEACFSVLYKGQMPWAFNRESALALHDYLGSAERNPGGSPWRSFLRHIPGPFKSRKARQPLTRLIKRSLTPG